MDLHRPESLRARLKFDTERGKHGYRGEKKVVKAGMTVNIPANAPHFFTNIAGKRARLLCMCSPAGQEEFFMAIGSPVDSRTTTAPTLGKEQQADFMKKAASLAPQFRTELLPL